MSDRWVAKRDEVARQRMQRQEARQQTWHQGANNGFAMPPSTLAARAGGAGKHYGQRPLIAQAVNGAPCDRPTQSVAMQDLDSRSPGSSGVDEYESSDDEGPERTMPLDGVSRLGSKVQASAPGRGWNDVPDDFVRAGPRSGSRGRRKGD